MKEIILTSDLSDLKIGDQIVVNSLSEMRCYKVMELARVSKKKTYWNGKTRYIAVKCRAAVEEKTSSGVYPNGRTWTRNWKEYEFRKITDSDPIIKVDLNFKNIIIINREQEWM
jgi:hypothetical protein